MTEKYPHSGIVEVKENYYCKKSEWMNVRDKITNKYSREVEG
jgi:hypothetical protein